MELNKTHTNALKLLWTDVCTVTEFREYLKENKSSGFKEIIVYENIPCKLSFVSLQPVNQTETAAELIKKAKLFIGSERVKLFIGNDVVIRPGSKLTVKRKNRIYEFKQSGNPAVFGSHQEIMLVPFESYA
jgi:hypothetical protein